MTEQIVNRATIPTSAASPFLPSASWDFRIPGQSFLHGPAQHAASSPCGLSCSHPVNSRHCDRQHDRVSVDLGCRLGQKLRIKMLAVSEHLGRKIRGDCSRVDEVSVGESRNVGREYCNVFFSFYRFLLISLARSALLRSSFVESGKSLNIASQFYEWYEWYM